MAPPVAGRNGWRLTVCAGAIQIDLTRRRSDTMNPPDMNVFRCLAVILLAASTAIPAGAQSGLHLGVGPVVPLGVTGDDLSTGLHVQTTIPFSWWIPPIRKIPGLSRLPRPRLPERLGFLRPRLSWRGDLQYEQLAGPDRPVRVIAASAVGTRTIRVPRSWFITPYFLGGVGAYNTQFYLPDPDDAQHPANADVRTNVGLDAGLGIGNQLAGYPISLEAKYRWVRNALSDPTGNPIPMRTFTIAFRYPVGRGW
jgi:hypothetical protein